MNELFQPIALGTMTVKNRFVRSATNDYLGNPDGSISDPECRLYEELAQNEIGLIISGHAYVQHPTGRASRTQNALFDDRFMDGYRKLADIVHAHGSKLVVQISHAGRQTLPELIEGRTPVAPSPVPDASTGVTPQEMGEADIQQLINDFVRAMVRAESSGSDGVQVHLAHGYCLAQFISPYTNRRTDQWGGCIENRTRIVREIMSRGRRALSRDFPVLVKLNGTDGKKGPQYLSIEDVLYTARLLENLGVAAIEVSGGIREIPGVVSAADILRPDQEAYFASAAQAIKSAVKVPVILVGGIRSRAIMEKVIADKIADMVALSRPFIREPDLVIKLKSGAAEASCISCNACFDPRGLECRTGSKS
jgi:2,4-dienoyl-CoA reductase-like NADH-dependent reductase (Old Yellow Enzyme family)